MRIENITLIYGRIAEISAPYGNDTVIMDSAVGQIPRSNGSTERTNCPIITTLYIP